MLDLYMKTAPGNGGAQLGTVVETASPGDVVCHTTELKWLDNAPSVSCIPAGRYPAILYHSVSKRRLVPQLRGVPGRSFIQFHAAFRCDHPWLEGCSGTGAQPSVWDEDLLCYLAQGSERAEDALVQLMLDELRRQGQTPPAQPGQESGQAAWLTLERDALR